MTLRLLLWAILKVERKARENQGRCDPDVLPKYQNRVILPGEHEKNPGHLRMTAWDWRSVWAGGARVALPFIRSRMKQSLSGVWKAYVIHTMKGQSCGEADMGLEQRGLLCSPAQRSHFQLIETLKPISNILHWSCLKSTHYHHSCLYRKYANYLPGFVLVSLFLTIAASMLIINLGSTEFQPT